jgi:hypothetical protein
VYARQAWQTHRVTTPVAIGFWIAYANLSKLTAVRFAELGFSKRRVWIRDFAGSLLGRI